MYYRPTTLDEALAARAAGAGTVLAGGTDVFPALVDRPPPASLLDISALSELRGIEFSSDEIRIGARTTWTEIARADLPPAFDALRLAAREVGAIQIQNRGTIGGNLCNASPAADGVPPLLVLDAAVELASPKGRRREPLQEFILGNRATTLRPDELLTAVIVPKAAAGGRSAFHKLGARRFLVISIAMVAVRIQADAADRVRAARIAVGSCSVVARRLFDLEHALLGREARAGLGEVAGPEHGATLAPIDDVRATADYRRDAALQLVRRAIELCVAEARA